MGPRGRKTFFLIAYVDRVVSLWRSLCVAHLFLRMQVVFGEPHIRWCLALGGKLGRGVPFIEWEQVWKVFRYDDAFAVEWI